MIVGALLYAAWQRFVEAVNGLVRNRQKCGRVLAFDVEVAHHHKHQCLFCGNVFLHPAALLVCQLEVGCKLFSAKRLVNDKSLFGTYIRPVCGALSAAVGGGSGSFLLAAVPFRCCTIVFIINPFHFG